MKNTTKQMLTSAARMAGVCCQSVAPARSTGGCQLILPVTRTPSTGCSKAVRRDRLRRPPRHLCSLCRLSAPHDRPVALRAPSRQGRVRSGRHTPCTAVPHTHVHPSVVEMIEAVCNPCATESGKRISNGLALPVDEKADHGFSRSAAIGRNPSQLEGPVTRGTLSSPLRGCKSSDSCRT